MTRKTLIYLCGAPGAGKTSLGRRLELCCEISAKFYSVGDTIRDIFGYKPPFVEVNHSEVIHWIYSNYSDSLKNILIIDCNPYPPEMVEACKGLHQNFTAIYYIIISARENILLERMKLRGRVDHPNFSYSDRITYFKDKVLPEIALLKNSINPRHWVELENNDTIEILKQKLISKLYE